MINRTTILIALAVVALAALGVYVAGLIYPYDTTGEGAKRENIPRDFMPWSRGVPLQW